MLQIHGTPHALEWNPRMGMGISHGNDKRSEDERKGVRHWRKPRAINVRGPDELIISHEDLIV